MLIGHVSTTSLPSRAFSLSEASRVGIDSRQLYRLLESSRSSASVTGCIGAQISR